MTSELPYQKLYPSTHKVCSYILWWSFRWRSGSVVCCSNFFYTHAIFVVTFPQTWTNKHTYSQRDAVIWQLPEKNSIIIIVNRLTSRTRLKNARWCHWLLLLPLLRLRCVRMLVTSVMRRPWTSSFRCGCTHGVRLVAGWFVFHRWSVLMCWCEGDCLIYAGNIYMNIFDDNYKSKWADGWKDATREGVIRIHNAVRVHTSCPKTDGKMLRRKKH